MICPHLRRHLLGFDAERQRDVDQPDEDRDLDERTDDAGEGLPGRRAVGGDGDGDREFEVVARGRERQRGGALIAQAEHGAEKVAAAPHDGEVRQQRQRDARDVQGSAGDLITLQRKQNDDGEQQAVQSPRTDPRQERGLVPVAAL